MAVFTHADDGICTYRHSERIHSDYCPMGFEREKQRACENRRVDEKSHVFARSHLALERISEIEQQERVREEVEEMVVDERPNYERGEEFGQRVGDGRYADSKCRQARFEENEKGAEQRGSDERIIEVFLEHVF